MRKSFTPSRKTCITFALAIGVMMSFGFVDRFFEIARNLEIFASVYKEVNQVYVDEVSPGQLMNTGIEAMLAALDPYTEFVDESHLEDYRMSYVSPQYAGIGATFFTKDKKIIVGEPLEGFAAHKSDLRAGDVIL